MLAMEMRSLGASGMQVSRLCFGTLTMGPMQRGFSPERGAALLTYAYARGFRFLDTADIYDTYPHIRLALQKCAYRVSTKAYCWDKATASAALERAFFGLDREYVDVFMLHEQESIHTLRGHREALDYLNEQKAKGRIGLVGVSTHYAGCVRAAAVFGGVDVIHPLINVEVHMYFEVHNSDLWGGKGSVGYMEIGYCECKNIIINELNSDFIERQIEFAANSACVDKKYVRPITKQEYDEKSNDKND